MTEVEIKELARKYINRCTKRANFVILAEGLKGDFIDLFVAGFMKCLELNKGIKWHDLRKDPNDLPESYMSILNQDGEKVMYDYSYKVWRCDDADEYICDTPIAWCEIPKYAEE